MQRNFPWLEIDLRAVSNNLAQIKKRVGSGVKVAGVVKANAYGHGIEEIAGFLEEKGIDYLCVARIGEALRLRRKGIKTPVLILGYTPAYFFKEVVENDLTVTIRSLDVVKALATEARRKNKIVRVHVKVETGMHRMGIETPQILFFLKRIFDLPNIEVEGIFTHFAEADSPLLSFTKSQLERFTEVYKELQKAKIKIPIFHCANSAGTLRLEESYFNMVRVGIALYGLEPSIEVDYPFNFYLALSFKTKIVQVKEVGEGETVGYGRTFEVEKKTLVATIAVGYGDGFRRSPENWGEVLVKGKRCSILGRVAMDACQIDVSEVRDVNVGDEVVLIGKSENEIITVDEVAGEVGTVNYEIVSGFMERVERVYKR